MGLPGSVSSGPDDSWPLLVCHMYLMVTGANDIGHRCSTGRLLDGYSVPLGVATAAALQATTRVRGAGKCSSYEESCRRWLIDYVCACKCMLRRRSCLACGASYNSAGPCASAMVLTYEHSEYAKGQEAPTESLGCLKKAFRRTPCRPKSGMGPLPVIQLYALCRVVHIRFDIDVCRAAHIGAVPRGKRRVPAAVAQLYMSANPCYESNHMIPIQHFCSP